MKLNEWDECEELVQWNLWQGKTGETPRKPIQMPFRPLRNPPGTRDPSDGWLASNLMRHGAASNFTVIIIIVIIIILIIIIIIIIIVLRNSYNIRTMIVNIYSA